jgi:hypothetical protein
MRRLLAALVAALVLGCSVLAADPEIAGNWIGAVETNRGAMDIGLRVTATDGKLAGTLKTAHGDWEVTSITTKSGEWTVTFKGDGNEGQMTGRIVNNKFTGDWKSKMANGTFEMTRAKKKN